MNPLEVEMKKLDYLTKLSQTLFTANHRKINQSILATLIAELYTLKNSFSKS